MEIFPYLSAQLPLHLCSCLDLIVNLEIIIGDANEARRIQRCAMNFTNQNGHNA